MRRPPAAIDLEVVAPDGSTPESVRVPSAGSGRRRHWPVTLIAAVLVGVGLAGPGRIQVAAAELRRVDRAWTEFSADETGQRLAIASVWNAALPTDGVLVNQAILRLDEEESERLAGLDRRLAGAVVIDRGVGRLRTAIQDLMRQRVTVLHNAELIRMRSQSGPATAVETWYPPLPAIAQVLTLLSAERGRFGVTEVVGGRRIQPYQAADGVLAAMSSDHREARSASISLGLSRPRRSRFKYMPA